MYQVNTCVTLEMVDCPFQVCMYGVVDPDISVWSTLAAYFSMGQRSGNTLKLQLIQPASFCHSLSVNFQWLLVNSSIVAIKFCRDSWGIIMVRLSVSTSIPIIVSKDPDACFFSLWGRLISSQSSRIFTQFEGMNLWYGPYQVTLWMSSGLKESSEWLGNQYCVSSLQSMRQVTWMKSNCI